LVSSWSLHRSEKGVSADATSDDSDDSDDSDYDSRAASQEDLEDLASFLKERACAGAESELLSEDADTIALPLEIVPDVQCDIPPDHISKDEENEDIESAVWNNVWYLVFIITTPTALVADPGWRPVVHVRALLDVV
jgi:hypothetical protein